MSKEGFNRRHEYGPCSATALKELLDNFGIPYKEWGSNGAKTVRHLLSEILDGECILAETDTGLVRVVCVAGVKIFYKKKDGTILKLHELRQEFNNGSSRGRVYETSLAEKVKRGERDEEAALRGIREELGIHDRVDLRRDGFGIKPTNGASFPGLHSDAHVTIFSAELTSHQFHPGGYVERQADKTTYFAWREEKKPQTA